MSEERATIIALALLVVLIALSPGCGKQPTGRSPGAAPRSSGDHVVPQEERVIYDYYDAINQKRYQDAYNLTSDDFKAQFPTFSDFEDSYEKYISSVKVVSLTRLDRFSTNQRIEYRAVYDATYLRPYPTGDGKLPPVNVVIPDTVNEDRWLLDKISTEP